MTPVGGSWFVGGGCGGRGRGCLALERCWSVKFTRRQAARLYHEETGDETTFGGPSAEWTRWILDRLATATTPAGPVGPSPSMMSMQIVDARLVDDRLPAVGDGDVWVELHLRVNGMAELNEALGAKVVGVMFGPRAR